MCSKVWETTNTVFGGQDLVRLLMLTEQRAALELEGRAGSREKNEVCLDRQRPDSAKSWSGEEGREGGQGGRGGVW